MSAVDGMLKIMVESGGKSMRLAAGSPARILDVAGTAHEASSQALTRQEILQLIGPIVPEQARRRLPQETSVDFDYTSPSGPFKVTILRNGTEIVVSFVPDAGRDCGGACTTCAVAAVATCRRRQAPRRHPRHRRRLRHRSPRSSAAHRAIDRLFRLMVEAKASDLHLSSGMPPLVRKDGHIQPLEEGAAPLTHDDIVALMEPITPETNRAEFAQRNDTDFAYEIKGLARFRANMFLDRKGRGAVFRVIPAKILSAEELGLSPHILKLCRLNKGLVLVTGPTGSGKSTTLCAMIDYINRTAHRSHHHHRGSDRVRAREQGLPDQPARGRHPHRRIQERAARRDARGSGHHPGRRAARPRDGGDRDRDGGDRATWCSARCTPPPRRRPSIA